MVSTMMRRKTFPGPVPMAFVVWMVCAGLAIAALRAFPFGRSLYAIGNNPVGARFSGLPVGRILLVIYARNARRKGWLR